MFVDILSTLILIFVLNNKDSDNRIFNYNNRVDSFCESSLSSNILKSLNTSKRET